MIKAVLFDFGGVLSETGQHGFIQDIVADLYGVSPEQVDTSQWHSELRRGRGAEDGLFNQLNVRFGKQVTKEQFVQSVLRANKPAPEVFELAVSLREHGIKTGIFSNIFEMNARELRRQGMYDHFDPVLLSWETGYAKPDQQFYDLAVKKLGMLPEEIILIDDQEKCLEPAAAMGMYIIKAVSPEQIVQDTKRLLKQLNNITL
jgi:epoxide hydrolase-like predicted phosphatase